jgi:membrane protease YdiL (CAAX protease family)
MGSVLSWLTLRSRSLLPATVAHWLSNVGVYSLVGEPDYPGRIWVRTACWLLVACILFHFWPIDEKGSRDPASERVDPEPAAA